MPRVDFDALPDHGRMWVFPASRVLSETEASSLLVAVDAFLDGWAAHGVPLASARELRDGQFLVVGVDEDVEAPSGCSIDALTNQLRGLGREMDVSLIEHGPVWFRSGQGIRSVSRGEFRRLADEGEVSVGTLVFDTSLTRVSRFREGFFEQPAANTWHRRAFFRGEADS
jgi:hypothetical protein